MPEVRVMRRFVLILVFLVGACLPITASAPPMVGTVTFSRTTIDARGVFQYTWAWTSDASGNVSGNAKEVTFGVIAKAEFDPSATAPTDNYDVTLLDTSGNDVLQGAGADRDTA